MRVDQLELTNFRGIRRLTLDFPARSAVLIGANGAGKSSILDALSVLLRQLVDEIQHAFSPEKPEPLLPP